VNGLLAPKWHWLAGLRVEQRLAHYRDTGGFPIPDARDTMLGGQASVSRDLADGTLAYTTLSRGYKAGGFNLGEVPQQGQRDFQPEFLWNLEAGLKTGLGGRGHTEVSVFYQWRYDQQVRTGVQAVPGDPNTYKFITMNLPKGYGMGLEASMQYEVSRGLQVGASLGLLRTRSGAFTMQDENGDPRLVRSRENAHAPSYTAAFNATWRGSNGFMARMDLTAKDAFYFDVPTDHDQKSKAYALANFKIGYERERWSAYAWLRNAFDKQYAVRGFYFENEPPDWETRLYLQRGDPRQFGLTAELRF
jgi:outer membrane receptor protein involved in Fe transport